MVNKLNDLIADLNTAAQGTDVKAFNDILLKIFYAAPRRMTKVSNYLAETPNDFGRIVNRENDFKNILSAELQTKNAQLSQANGTNGN